MSIQQPKLLFNKERRMSNSGFVPPVPGQQSAPKKSRWWVYGLAGCGGFLVIVVVIVVAGGAYLWTKVPKNEGEMVAKIIELANPEVEVLKMDTGAGIVTVRNKKTGETLSWSLEDAKQGKFSVTKDGKTESLTFSQDGQIKLETEKGIATWGANLQDVPDWVPAYPGAKSEGGLTSSEMEKRTGTVTYSTSDQLSDVIAFYEQELQNLGLEPDQDQSYQSGNMAAFTAVSADESRKVTVTASRFESKTSIQVAYSEDEQ
jgi:hypothetical protein